MAAIVFYPEYYFAFFSLRFGAVALILITLPYILRFFQIFDIRKCHGFSLCLCFLLGLGSNSLVLAHPEDDFCASDMAMDPALCAQLAAIDSGGDVAALPAVTGSIGEVLSRYFIYGIDHIFPSGIDHLLFIAALVFSVKRWLPLLGLVSAFTLAHTVSIFAVSLSWISAPGPWVELAIAASIAWVACQNALGRQSTRSKVAWGRDLSIVFGFGLLHGLGFASALQTIGLPLSFFVVALLGFNLGVEAAQILFAALLFCLLCWRIANNTARLRDRLLRPVNVLIAIIAMGLVATRI